MLAFGWAGKKAGDGASRRGEDEPGDLTSSWARDIAAGMPVNGGGELTRDGAVDWAKPQASEPSEDWERLSLSVSGTGSWNAFAAATPGQAGAEAGGSGGRKGGGAGHGSGSGPGRRRRHH